MASTIFSGNDIKLLKSILDFNGNAKILSGNLNPSITATSAPLGSLYLSTLTGLAYRKGDAGSSTNWTKVSSGSDGKNYIKFGDFENNATTGWSIGHTALTNSIPSGSSPTFGSGASANQVLTTTAIGPLSGLYSMSYYAPIATATGDLIATDPLTIDLEDQAKVLGFKFSYAVSGTLNAADFSGTSSSSFGVAIWDVTNSAWIIPAGVFNITQTSGVGICRGTFQTPSNMTQFRFVIFNANGTGGFINLTLDSFSVGPQSVSYTSPVSDPAPFTPTLTNAGNAVASRFYWWRVGNTMHVTGLVTIGSSVPTGTIIISIPSGASIDTNYTTRASGFSFLGSALGSRGSTSYSGSLIQDSLNNAVRIVGPSGAAWNATVPATWVNGDPIEVTMILPIAGWSSSAAISQSDSSEGRVVVATYQTTNSTTSITATAVLIPSGWVSLVDSFSAFDTSTGRYTAKVTGNYKVSCCFSFASAAYAVNQRCSAFVYVNGISIARLGGFTAQAAATFNPSVSGSLTVPVKAGDIIDVRLNSDLTTTLSGTQVNNTVSFELVPGNQSIMAAESVGARVTSSNGPSIGTSLAIVKFNGATYDSHGSYDSTSGLYTCSTSGKFSVSAFITLAAATLSTSQNLTLQLYKNGVRYSDLYTALGNGTSQNYRAGGSDEVSCVPGDTLEIWASCSVAGTLAADPKTNYAVFRRVGN